MRNKFIRNAAQALLLCASLLGCVGPLPAEVGDFLRTIPNPEPAAYDQFGAAIAVSGRRVLIGNRQDDVPTRQEGSAYLVAGKTGTTLEFLTNPTPDKFDTFGVTVAAGSDQFLVGTWRDDNQGATNTGVAYVYNQTGQLQHTLLNPTPNDDDRFGWSMALVNGNPLVGAYKEDLLGPDTGMVYLFNGATGQLMRPLYDPTPAVGDRFGYSVAGMGTAAVVGCYRESSVLPNSGAVYVFDTGSGQLLHSLFNPTPAPADLFGKTVVVAGNKIIVGAPDDDTGAVDAGAAYVFDGTTGQLLYTIANPIPAAGDEFGEFIAAVGEDFVVSAPAADAQFVDEGVAYLFDGQTGSLLATLNNPDPTFEDYFGGSLAGMVDEILIGAHRDDLGAVDSGTVYVFQGRKDVRWVPGDANADSQVTVADYTAWANGFGHFIGEAMPAEGDFNGDGFVTGADYTIWANNFTSNLPVSSRVPEPSGLALAIVAPIAIWLVRGRKRST